MVNNNKNDCQIDQLIATIVCFKAGVQCLALRVINITGALDFTMFFPQKYVCRIIFEIILSDSQKCFYTNVKSSKTMDHA